MKKKDIIGWIITGITFVTLEAYMIWALFTQY